MISESTPSECKKLIQAHLIHTKYAKVKTKLVQTHLIHTKYVKIQTKLVQTQLIHTKYTETQTCQNSNTLDTS